MWPSLRPAVSAAPESYGGGVGYQFNNWFRADVTGQYRGNSNFTGLDVVTGTGPAAGLFETDSYTATKSELLFLANAYADLGTWWCITPFVGAGVGTARVSIGNFTDTGDISNGASPPPHSLDYAGTNSKWNFAWALHAGLAYKVTPGLTVELAYSYVNMGNGLTGPSLLIRSSYQHHPRPVLVQRHHIQRCDAGLALGAEHPVGLSAAVGHQGLSELLIT